MTQKLSDAMGYDPIRGLFYGRSGGGKTTLWSLMTQFPKEFCPIYCYDFDLRLGGLRAVITPQQMELIEFDSYEDDKVQGEGFTKAEVKLRELEYAKNKGDLKFKTIAIDSLSFCNSKIMNRVLYFDGMKSKLVAPDTRHYVEQRAIMENFILSNRSLGVNLICCVHEDHDKDEVTGRTFKSIALTGKSSEKVPGFFNEYWHCEVRPMPGGGSDYVIQTKSDAIYSARSSYKSLIQFEAQKQIWSKIIAERKLIKA